MGYLSISTGERRISSINSIFHSLDQLFNFFTNQLVETCGPKNPGKKSHMFLPQKHEGVSKNNGTPKWMVYFMENPMNKWMIWGAHPYFWKHPCVFGWKMMEWKNPSRFPEGESSKPSRLGEVFQGVEFHVLVTVQSFVSQAKPMETWEFFWFNIEKTNKQDMNWRSGKRLT